MATVTKRRSPEKTGDDGTVGLAGGGAVTPPPVEPDGPAEASVSDELIPCCEKKLVKDSTIVDSHKL